MCKGIGRSTPINGPLKWPVRPPPGTPKAFTCPHGLRRRRGARVRGLFLPAAFLPLPVPAAAPRRRRAAAAAAGLQLGGRVCHQSLEVLGHSHKLGDRRQQVHVFDAWFGGRGLEGGGNAGTAERPGRRGTQG